MSSSSSRDQLRVPGSGYAVRNTPASVVGDGVVEDESCWSDRCTGEEETGLAPALV